MPRKKKEDDLSPTGGGALAKAREYARKKKGKEFEAIRVTLDHEALTESLPHLPTGSVVVDYLIGGEPNTFNVAPCPGLPRGRVSQIWGHESAGKTTLALTAAATACAQGGSVLYIDWENDIVPDYAAALGVPITDPDKFELLQPETLEDGIKYALIYAAAGVDLIVFDSVGAAAPKRIVERDAMEAAEQGKVGELQQIWSQELPNLKRLIAKTGTSVMGISQIRAKINTGPSRGPSTQPQGGNAWKFYSSVRLELRRVQNEKAREHNVLTHRTDERVVGGIIKVKAVKCKLSRSQGREEIFYIRWGEGIDNHRSIIEIAISHGIIHKSGSWVSLDRGSEEPVKVQGVNKLRKYLMDHPDEFETLQDRVYPLLGSGVSAGQFQDEAVDESEADNSAIDKTLASLV